jgi:hypothetical protein
MSPAVTARRMMASELSSALTIATSSTWSGRRRSTLPIASRRSLAATLMSTESSNSTTMRALPASLEEEIDATPGMRAAALSSSLVTWVSTVSGVAPS